jgi:hypothetical protein
MQNDGFRWMPAKKNSRGRTPCLFCGSLRSPGAPRPTYRHLGVRIATRRYKHTGQNLSESTDCKPSNMCFWCGPHGAVSQHLGMAWRRHGGPRPLATPARLGAGLEQRGRVQGGQAAAPRTANTSCACPAGRPTATASGGPAQHAQHRRPAPATPSTGGCGSSCRRPRPPTGPTSM